MNAYTSIHILFISDKLFIVRKPGFVKLLLILNCLFFFLPVSAQIIRSASGPNVASITPTRDAFRADLGGGTVAGANGSFGGVRREINWDGVPDAFSAPNNLPANFFNVNSPRGIIFSTPGTGFQVSANAAIAPVQFGNINPSYPSLFEPFSPQRLFTALGSNINDYSFFVAGTNTPALTRGFGAIFSDVDLSNVTSIQYFDRNNVSLGTFFVPASSGNETFSFFGISYPTPIIARARITSGNAILGAANNENLPSADLVVMDDFIYGEPLFVCPTINVTIPDAYALPSGVLANTVYIGYPPASSITLTSTVSGGIPPYTYTWSNGSHANAITVSPTVATTYTLTVTDANGCKGTASKTINVIDVRGGHNMDKVIICHKPNKQNHTLTIGEDGVADHLSHGDMLGSCLPSARLIVMDNKTDNSIDKGVSMAVKNSKIQMTPLVAKVFPNPSAKYFTLRVQQANTGAMQIRVIDMHGHLIEQRDNVLPGETINFGNTYKPGTYTLEIIQGSIKKQQKIIKTD